MEKRRETQTDHCFSFLSLSFLVSSAFPLLLCVLCGKYAVLQFTQFYIPRLLRGGAILSSTSAITDSGVSPSASAAKLASTR